MEFRQPKVILLAETKIDAAAENQLLRALGVEGERWSTDARSDGERLIEVCGRLCYKAFGIELNKNLTKVREGNYGYIGNILGQKHGSVLSHASVTFALVDVSRILTHELVRHGAGTAFSQESGRFVRVDNIGMYLPDLTSSFTAITGFDGNRLQAEFEDDMREITEIAEEKIKKYSNMLDQPGILFKIKKKIQSALRRMAPSGQLNSIAVTANHRAWRHMIAMRTSEGAEDEIRYVFNNIAEQLFLKFPAIYQDMSMVRMGGVEYGYTFEHDKV